MGSGVDSWEGNDTISVARTNQKTIFIGASEPATMYVGMIWFDTSASVGVFKQRNKDNDAWSIQINQSLLITSSPTFAGLTISDTNYISILHLNNDLIFRSRADVGDSQDRFQIYSGGALEWGSGAAGVDVVLARDSANVLRLYDTLQVDIQLLLPLVGSSGGLVIGGDVNLYRASANVLKTDDAFELQSSTNTLGVKLFASNIWSFYSDYGGGVYPFMIQPSNNIVRIGDGFKLEWGVLGFPDDVNLYRSATDLLKTDDSLEVKELILTGANNYYIRQNGGLSAFLLLGSGMELQGNGGTDIFTIDNSGNGKFWGSLIVDGNVYFPNLPSSDDLDDLIIIQNILIRQDGYLDVNTLPDRFKGGNVGALLGLLLGAVKQLDNKLKERN